MGKLGNVVSTTKMFLNFFGNIFASQEANFLSATMFPEMGKQGNINRKDNVSATMFPSLPRALVYGILSNCKLSFDTPCIVLGKQRSCRFFKRTLTTIWYNVVAMQVSFPNFINKNH